MDAKKEDYTPVGEVRDMFTPKFTVEGAVSEGKTIVVPFVEFLMETEADAVQMGAIIAGTIFPSHGFDGECVGAISIKVDDNASWSDDFVFQPGDLGGMEVHSLLTEEEAKASGLPRYQSDMDANAAPDGPATDDTIR